MSDTLLKRLARWGWAGPETTIGTAIASTIGIPVLNDTAIAPGQEFVEERKATGRTTLSITEVKDDVINPTFTCDTTLFYPQFGEWVALLCQSVTESGTGPYGYAITPDVSNGKSVFYGDTGALENYTGTLWQLLGQTTSRDVVMSGVVVSQIDVTIPESGRVSVTPTFMGLKYDDDSDGSGGVYTLPGTGVEIMARDLVAKMGGGPSALYSREISFSLVGDWVARRYGGQNDAYPYKLICNGWSLTGSLSKPILAATDTLSEDHLIGGGDSGLDQRLFIYSKTMTDYDELIGTMSNGEMRFTLNIKLDEAVPGGDDELVENVTFKGLDDLTNGIFKYELVTTAQQSWGS
jgi:hypothetical protein